MSSSYHPQTDGQSEVLNRCLETYLRSFVCDEPKNWARYLPWAEWWYNTTEHSSTGTTPFEAVYRMKPPTILRHIPGSTTVTQLEAELNARDKVLDELKLSLRRAQLRMKKNADKGRTDKTFEVHDWVFVKLQPYRQTSVNARHYPKLAKRYYGSFEILQRLGPVAYKLALPAAARIHPVFHVSLLKRCFGPPTSSTCPLPDTVTANRVLLQPICSLATRTIMRNGNAVRQVLLQWEGELAEDATWEDLNSIHQAHPNLILEDKDSSGGDGNVTTAHRPRSDLPRARNTSWGEGPATAHAWPPKQGRINKPATDGHNCHDPHSCGSAPGQQQEVGKLP